MFHCRLKAEDTTVQKPKILQSTEDTSGLLQGTSLTQPKILLRRARVHKVRRGGVAASAPNETVAMQNNSGAKGGAEASGSDAEDGNDASLFSLMRARRDPLFSVCHGAGRGASTQRLLSTAAGRSPKPSWGPLLQQSAAAKSSAQPPGTVHVPTSLAPSTSTAMGAPVLGLQAIKAVHRRLPRMDSLSAADASTASPGVISSRSSLLSPFAPSHASLSTSGRGTYSRSDGKGRSEAWKPHVERYAQALANGTLLTSGECDVKRCPNNGTCSKMLSISIVEREAVASFGENIVVPGARDWSQITKMQAANANWYARIQGAANRGIDGAVEVIDYRIGGVAVCWKQWGHFNGVKPATMCTMDIKARAGDVEWNAEHHEARLQADREAQGRLGQVAAAWWHERLLHYECRTKEGLIVHPRDINWSSVYEHEFVPFMRLMGYNWKLVAKRQSPEELITGSDERERTGDDGCDGDDEYDDENDEGDGDCEGSRSTWYRGRLAALEQLGKEKLGDGKKFKFESRKKHSAYKECPKCKVKRLHKAALIARRAPIKEIMDADKEVYRRHACCHRPSAIHIESRVCSCPPLQIRDHIQWMLRQRRVIERLTQMALNEFILVENSDKCGDECLHLPTGGGRITSGNASLYKYRLSLQANVFSAKLFHLTLLLPGLSTGANFGITCFITGVCQMVRTGTLLGTETSIYRGFDGDSANVCLCGLAFNCSTIHRRSWNFNLLQQHRLPPDHSHVWQTDGLFSVVEGWLNHEGFTGGARTVSHLVQFLRQKFANSNAYKEQRVEISILIACFAFTKLYEGCIDSSELAHIGVPLVWRHTWSEAGQCVISQYKLALSDEATFQKDEWGPWLDAYVEVHDDVTGKTNTQRVLRSDPKGVTIMKKYPDLSELSCLDFEAWHEPDSWKRDKVFSDVLRWKYDGCTQEQAAAAKAEWQAVRNWHLAHPTVDSVSIPGPIRLPDGTNLNTTPVLSWSSMVKLLDSRACAAPPTNTTFVATFATAGAEVNATATVASVDAEVNATMVAHSQLSSQLTRLRYADREVLQTAATSATANVVSHAGFSETARVRGVHNDPLIGNRYVTDFLDTNGALLLIELQHAEGEFKVGLGRRTFNSTMDKPEERKYEIQWFERKSRQDQWGQTPSFKLCVAGYDTSRRAIIACSVESAGDILAIEPRVTDGSVSTPDTPRLRADVMQAVRQRYPQLVESLADSAHPAHHPSTHDSSDDDERPDSSDDDERPVDRLLLGQNVADGSEGAAESDEASEDAEGMIRAESSGPSKRKRKSPLQPLSLVADAPSKRLRARK